MECSWRSRSTLQPNLACGEHSTRVIFRSFSNRSYHQLSRKPSQIKITWKIRLFLSVSRTGGSSDWIYFFLQRRNLEPCRCIPSPQHRGRSLTSVHTRASSVTRTPGMVLQYPNCKRTPKTADIVCFSLGVFYYTSKQSPCVICYSCFTRRCEE